jgi:hypothetical protein
MQEHGGAFGVGAAGGGRAPLCAGAGASRAHRELFPSRDIDSDLRPRRQGRSGDTALTPPTTFRGLDT